MDSQKSLKSILDKDCFEDNETETPQLPRTLLDRSATLKQAARGKVSPRNGFKNAVSVF